MKKTVIFENQRGFLFNNGRFVKLLGAGSYAANGERRRIEVVSLDAPVASEICSTDVLLANAEVAANTVTVEVPEQHIALHFVDGRLPAGSVLRPGRYAFWNIGVKHEFQLIDISSAEVSPEVPEYIFTKLPAAYYIKAEVAEYQKARLFIGKKLVKLLDAGTYYFWRNGESVEVDTVDTRVTCMNVTGQELLTQDKVSVRVSFVCNYRITDYVRVLTEIDDCTEQLHIAAQLALRDYVGRHKLDEILENKDEMTEYVTACLKEKEESLFVEICGAGVKDIILPGEIRDIMNSVLAAEKRAQAGVITRREEVASTRSLLNTAKLMDENRTLYKLKELEYVERICGNVGSISLSGSGDMLTQLTALLRGGEKEESVNDV